MQISVIPWKSLFGDILHQLYPLQWGIISPADLILKKVLGLSTWVNFNWIEAYPEISLVEVKKYLSSEAVELQIHGQKGYEFFFKLNHKNLPCFFP